MKKENKKRWFISIVFLISFILILFIILRHKRTHNKWVVDLKLSNEEVVSVIIDQNYRKIYSFPSGPLELWRFGGDDCKYYLYFKYKTKGFEFRSKGEPFLLNVWENKIYLAILFDEGKTKTSSLKKFKFFTYNTDWIEIRSEDFPKQISIANLIFSLNYPYYGNSDNINENIENSITARLWLKLIKGIDFYQSKDMDTHNFALEFKNKYIEPFWSGKNFKEYLPKVKHYKQK